MFFKRKKERQERQGKVAFWSIAMMKLYLASRKKHFEKLTIFDGPKMDDNVNRLGEAIFLLGFYDALIKHHDNKLKYLKIKDAAGFLNAEFQSYKELEGYTVWLEHALKEGTYTSKNYSFNDTRIKPINSLFYAGHKCFERMLENKEEGLIPMTIGIENEGYDLYDFKEFSDLKEIWETELQKSFGA